jgi:hypothetical protein
VDSIGAGGKRCAFSAKLLHYGSNQQNFNPAKRKVSE